MTKYTKRHYEEVASVLADEGQLLRAIAKSDKEKYDNGKMSFKHALNLKTQDNASMETLQSIAKRFDAKFRADNERYRTETFYKACNIGEFHKVDDRVVFKPIEYEMTMDINKIK